MSAKSYGVYAKPLSSALPSGGFADPLPVNEQTMAKVAALYDMICERIDAQRADFQFAADKRNVVIPGAPLPAVRNAIADAETPFLDLAKHLALYNALVSFFTTSRQFAFPSASQGERYPSWSSGLTTADEMIVAENFGCQVQFGNATPGNANLPAFDGTSRTVTSPISDAARQYFADLSFSDNFHMDDYGIYAQQKINDLFKLAAGEIGECDSVYDVMQLDPAPLCWRLLNASAALLKDLDASFYTFTPFIPRVGHTKVTRDAVYALNATYLEEFIRSNATVDYQAVSEYHSTYYQRTDTSSQALPASDAYGEKRATQTSRSGRVKAYVDGRIVWNTAGDWEYVSTVRFDGGTTTNYRKRVYVSDVIFSGTTVDIVEVPASHVITEETTPDRSGYSEQLFVASPGLRDEGFVDLLRSKACAATSIDKESVTTAQEAETPSHGEQVFVRELSLSDAGSLSSSFVTNLIDATRVEGEISKDHSLGANVTVRPVHKSDLMDLAYYITKQHTVYDDGHEGDVYFSQHVPDPVDPPEPPTIDPVSGEPQNDPHSEPRSDDEPTGDAPSGWPIVVGFDFDEPTDQDPQYVKKTLQPIHIFGQNVYSFTSL